MRELGASEDDIDARRAQWDADLAERAGTARYECGAWRTEAGELLSIDVLPENRDAWQVFVALGSQWESPGSFGGRCCVPLTDVDVALRMMVPRARREDAFDRLRVLLAVARNCRLEEIDRTRGKS